MKLDIVRKRYTLPCLLHIPGDDLRRRRHIPGEAPRLGCLHPADRLFEPRRLTAAFGWLCILRLVAEHLADLRLLPLNSESRPRPAGGAISVL